MNYLMGGIAVIILAIIGFNSINTKKEINQPIVQKSEYKKISQEEAKKRIDAENDIIILDVRTKEEYDEKHIPNSMLIPVDVIESDILTKITDKNAKIFVYCRSGNRSRTASNIIINLGYTNVFDFGGIIDWKYETEISK